MTGGISALEALRDALYKYSTTTTTTTTSYKQLYRYSKTCSLCCILQWSPYKESIKMKEHFTFCE